jgi:hypothetical protein
MRVSVGYVLCLLTAALGAAQAQDMKPPKENPVALYKGLGAWHHPIAARNPEAQKYFDQGLALLYGFNRYEALCSFRKAAELDPTAAIPWWGMAMATGPYINMGTEGDGDLDSKAACRAVEAGLKIPDSAPRERAYLEAAATRCPEYKPDVYVAAMKSLAKRYPDDLDAATFYAESLMVPVRWHWYSHFSPQVIPLCGPGLVKDTNWRAYFIGIRRSNTWSAIVNTALLAPMPRASEKMATMVNSGLRRKLRIA